MLGCDRWFGAGVEASWARSDRCDVGAALSSEPARRVSLIGLGLGRPAAAGACGDLAGY
jgi:hypothetical protein